MVAGIKDDGAYGAFRAKRRTVQDLRAIDEEQDLVVSSSTEGVSAARGDLHQTVERHDGIDRQGGGGAGTIRKTEVVQRSIHRAARREAHPGGVRGVNRGAGGKASEGSIEAAAREASRHRGRSRRRLLHDQWIIARRIGCAVIQLDAVRTVAVGVRRPRPARQDGRLIDEDIVRVDDGTQCAREFLGLITRPSEHQQGRAARRIKVRCPRAAHAILHQVEPQLVGVGTSDIQNLAAADHQVR